MSYILTGEDDATVLLSVAIFSDFRKYKGLSLYIQFLFTKEKGSLFNMKVWMKLLVKKKGPYPFWI